jgi:probable rRNA maturation factor
VSAGDLPIAVSLVDEQETPVDEARLRGVALRVATAEGASGEISILLVDSGRIADLNRRYLDGSGPTDVLAFPVDGLITEPPAAGGPPVLIGEVVLSPEVALQQAPPGPDGLGSELDLLVAHGVLHLLGYDHDTEEAAAAMRLREEDACGRSGASAT